MDKSVKIVLILAILFLIVIVWAGLKNKMGPALEVKVEPSSAALKLEPSLPKDKLIKLSPNQLEKIDQGLMELEERKKGMTPEQAQTIEELQRILQSAKAKGRLPTPEERSILMRPFPRAGFLPPLPEEELAPEESLPEEEFPEQLRR